MAPIKKQTSLKKSASKDVVKQASLVKKTSVLKRPSLTKQATLSVEESITNQSTLSKKRSSVKQSSIAKMASRGSSSKMASRGNSSHTISVKNQASWTRSEKAAAINSQVLKSSHQGSFRKAASPQKKASLKMKQSNNLPSTSGKVCLFKDLNSIIFENVFSLPVLYKTFHFITVILFLIYFYLSN